MAIQYVGGNTGKWDGAVSGTNTVSLTALTGGIASSASAGDSWAAVTLALRPELMQYTMPSASGSFQDTGSAAGLLSTRKAFAC